MATMGNNVASATTCRNNLVSLIFIHLICSLCLLSSSLHHESLQIFASPVPIVAKSSANGYDVTSTATNIATSQQHQHHRQQMDNSSSASIHTQTIHQQHNQFQPEDPLVYHLMTPEQQAELAESITKMSESIRPHQPRNSMILLIDLDKANGATQNHYHQYSDQQARVIKGWGAGKGFIG